MEDHKGTWKVIVYTDDGAPMFERVFANWELAKKFADSMICQYEILEWGTDL